MNIFRRLPRFGRIARVRAAPIWKAAAVQFERGLQWLALRPQAQAALFSVGMGLVALLLLIFSTVTAAVAAVAAWIALMRHFAQTNADRQRRITESFAKAVEQLGSDKLEVRLGGIYLLERISKESPDDYWTVMENLTAFVRERSRRNEAEWASQDVKQRVSRRAYLLWQAAGRPQGHEWAERFWDGAVEIEEEEIGEPPTADIEAVLAVITRRSDRNREREVTNAWTFDLSEAVLRRTSFWEAHLEGANFGGAHLEGANFGGAHLERAWLGRAHLESAEFPEAHLEDAKLGNAHFKGANLIGAHLQRADLTGAYLEGAELWDAHLEGAILQGTYLKGTDLRQAHLEGANIHKAWGDAATRLPAGLLRPGHWPPEAPEEEEP